MTVLQARPFRSVSLESRAGAPVVVKRFHHPAALLARFDRARARREFRALAALQARGVNVPPPLALEQSAGGWEVHLRAIPDARPLAACLASGTAPGGWNALLARLGRLLAALQCSGWEHGDLHPGNVLVDAQGKPWLIDVQRARRSPLDPSRFLREVVDCAATVREVLPERQRARFLVAWLAALPRELRPTLVGAALGRAIETRARLRRAELVRLGLGRWLRESSRVRRVAGEELHGWARRDLSARSPSEILAQTRVLVRGRADEVRARWLGAARLQEHALPALRPALFVPGARWSGRGAWAAFDAPPTACPEPTQLLAALAERGLGLRRAELACVAGGVCFAPPREPEDFLENA